MHDATAAISVYRLPRTVLPRRYELRIEPDLEAARYTGTVDITVEVVEPVTEVVLNARNLVIGDAWLTAADGSRMEATAEVDDDTERLHLRLVGSAAPGEWTMHLGFAGIVNDKLKGFYRSVFTDEAGVERVIGTTQMEPTDAREAFPCWDEPDLKAVFAVTLVVPEDLLAVSNGGEVERAPAGNGHVAVRFADTISMSTYLVAWVIGPLEATEAIDVDGVPLRVIHVPGKGHLTPFALDIGAFSLRLFAGYYGIPYPADKCDLIALPDFAAGAMENLGCITFRENALLVDPREATQAEVQRVADVVAHELAHMWFGDLVTMKWWNGIWLNEAFATFMELAAVDAFRPEWQRWAAFTNERAGAFAIDSLEATRPIEFPVLSPEDAEGMFDLLTYQKGASVLRMLEQYLGEDTFRAGIRRYLLAHELGNTETTDLWDAIEGAADDPVRRIMDSWIYQGGYPLVSVSAVGDDITFTQERFRFDDADRSARWSVPLLVAPVGGGAPVKVLLEGDSATVTLPGASTGVVVNAGGHGFYRVRYAPELLLALRDRLSSLEPVERAILVDDTWSSVLAGDTTATAFLGLAAAFSDEDDPAVWTTLVGALTSIDCILDGPGREGFRAWVRRLTAPAVERLGWTPADGEDELRRQTRQLVLTAAGRLGHDAEVQARARALLGPALAGEGVDPNVVAAAVGIVASVGTAADWDAFVERFRTASSPQEELRFQYALADLPLPALADRTLQLCLTELRSQNAPFVLLYLLQNREAQEVAWRGITANWDAIVDRFPGNTIPRLLGGITALSTPELAAEAEAFVRAHPVPQGGKTIDQHLERLWVNVAFRQRESARLAAHLS